MKYLIARSGTEGVSEDLLQTRVRVSASRTSYGMGVRLRRADAHYGTREGQGRV